MASLAQPPVSRERFATLVAELFGDPPAPAPQPAAHPSAQPPRWPQAVTQVTEQLCTTLGVPVAPERLRKALDLVLAHAVTLHADGTASVKSGTQTYTLAPECPCADARHRTECCKHYLAVELHRRALALLDGTAYAPAAAPSASPAAAAATPPAGLSAPTSAAWNVHEAPASCCLKWRVGSLELMYTLRGVDDTELQTRLAVTLPTLQDILTACEARAAQRTATREAPAAQAPQAPPAASAPADLQALLQQAVQQALTAQANGAAHGTPPPAAPSTGQRQAKAKTGDQATGFCSLHNVAMEHRENERGSWYSHWLPEEERHCKGRR